MFNIECLVLPHGCDKIRYYDYVTFKLEGTSVKGSSWSNSWVPDVPLYFCINLTRTKVFHPSDPNSIVYEITHTHLNCVDKDSIITSLKYYQNGDCKYEFDINGVNKNDKAYDMIDYNKIVDYKNKKSPIIIKEKKPFIGRLDSIKISKHHKNNPHVIYNAVDYPDNNPARYLDVAYDKNSNVISFKNTDFSTDIKSLENLIYFG